MQDSLYVTRSEIGNQPSALYQVKHRATGVSLTALNNMSNIKGKCVSLIALSIVSNIERQMCRW